MNQPHEADVAVLADSVAAAALSVPDVTALHGGAFGEVATHLAGRRVRGVRLREDLTEVHLVVGGTIPVLVTAEAVRAAVQPLVGTRVDVFVQDVERG